MSGTTPRAWRLNGILIIKMIESGCGSILHAPVDALVNTVNTVGVMGKGIALQFKKKFPEVFASYAQACSLGEIAIGKMHVVVRAKAPIFIVNFPTKKHWKHPSKIEYIEAGLRALVEVVRERKVRSIAIPQLGCGNGGLDWSTVRPRIEQSFSAVPDVRVLLFDSNNGSTASQLGFL